MIGFVPVSVTVGLLRAEGSFNQFNIVSAFPSVLYTLLIVGFQVAGHLDLHTALVTLFLAQIIWYAVVIIRFAAWPRRIPPRKVVFEELHYGARLVVGTLSEMIVNRLDQVVLVGFVSSRQLGLYAVAVTASGVSGPAAYAISNVLLPRLRASNDRWQMTKRTLLRCLLTSTAIASLVAATAPFVLPFLFGHQFHKALVPLWILLPGQIVFDLANVCASKLLIDNKPGAVSVAFGISAVVTVVGLALTVGPFGINGAAAITSVSELCFFVLTVRSARKPSPSGETHQSPAPDPSPSENGGMRSEDEDFLDEDGDLLADDEDFLDDEDLLADDEDLLADDARPSTSTSPAGREATPGGG
jgi:O-antigen/teichoic acid export membrane protein